MQITVIGSGYVGLVSGACLAEVGNQVLCLDVDSGKVAQLQRGEIPIFEPGLEELVQRNVSEGRLQFTADPVEATAHGLVQFIAVGTPPSQDGQADLSCVMQAAFAIGQTMDEYRLIINKSTVPVGTADRVSATISTELADRNLQIPFSVASNPEFLKEGAAIEDFMRPDRIVVGCSDDRARELLRQLYAPFQRNHERMIWMGIRSAELTKYAANAMLATRISFMNEMANLAEQVDADIEDVRKGIGADPRIGYQFLYPGVGFGGSCFPKDLQALARTARDAESPMHILDAVMDVNRQQKQRLTEKVVQYYGEDLHGKHFAVWGLAFKPDTDDLREAPSITIIEGLLNRGATVAVYDPIATHRAREVLTAPAVRFCEHALDALNAADALLIVTEWKQFRSPNFAELKQRLKVPLIVDGRNLYDPAYVREQGFIYLPIGRGAAAFSAVA